MFSKASQAGMISVIQQICPVDVQLFGINHVHKSLDSRLMMLTRQQIPTRPNESQSRQE